MTRTTLLSILMLGTALAAGLADPAGAAPPREVKRIVAAEAKDTAVPPSLALAIADVESGFRDDRESPEGARGVMQITPEVARSRGVDPQALWDARANVRLGLKIVGELFRDSGHQWPVALERYAAAIPGGEDGPQFARRVLRLERRFAEEIVTRDELEQRKREVLNIAGAADHAPAPPTFDPPPVPEPPAVAEAPAEADRPPARPGIQLAVRHTADGLGNDLQARLAAARRSLDDFAAGRIPADLMRGRRHRGIGR